jgi:hypothetical protein
MKQRTPPFLPTPLRNGASGNLGKYIPRFVLPGLGVQVPLLQIGAHSRNPRAYHGHHLPQSVIYKDNVEISR